MTNAELEKVADFLYERLMKRQEEDEEQSNGRFVLVYESEDGMIIDKLFEEITRLKQLVACYEEEEKFELAAKADEKIKRLEKKIMSKL